MMPLQTVDGYVAEYLANLGVPLADVLGTLITFVVSLLVLYYVGKGILLPFVRRLMDRRGLDAHAKNPLEKLSAILIGIASLAIAFTLAGFPNLLSSLATIAAAGTLAIGFALQDVIKNFVSGVFIFTDRPFRIGHWIEWDDNAGIVEDISLRVTRVRTFDNELLTVPNSNLTDDVIKNPVAYEQLRLQVEFGIGYDDDIDEATEIIVAEAEAHPEILGEPAPSVRLVELGDSSVGLQSRIWIDDPSRSDFVKTRGEYVKAVKERFDEAGIDIPYPNRTIGGGIDLANLEDLPEQPTQSTD